MEERKLYAREASPSMFVYCTEVLHLSEAEAYLRITVARASRKHPVLLTLLEDGRLHLTGIALLAPHLTQENRDAAPEAGHAQVQASGAGADRRDCTPARRSGRDAEASPAGNDPAHSVAGSEGSASSVELRPDGVIVRTGCREQSSGADGRAVTPVPRQSTGAASTTPNSFRAESVLRLLPSGRSRCRQGASRDRRAPLPGAVQGPVHRQRRAPGQAGATPGTHAATGPDGDLAAIIEQAVTEKLERLEAKRFAKTKAPRKGLTETDSSPSSRHIPAAVRRAVRERDGDRCRYVDEQGRRCPERGRLEYHHRHPFALGGDRSLRNISLMCHAHNQYLAEHDYGRDSDGPVSAVRKPSFRADSHLRGQGEDSPHQSRTGGDMTRVQSRISTASPTRTEPSRNTRAHTRLQPG